MFGACVHASLCFFSFMECRLFYGFIYKVKHFTVERSKAVKSIIHLGESLDSLSVVQGSTAVPVDLIETSLQKFSAGIWPSLLVDIRNWLRLAQEVALRNQPCCEI